VQPFDVIGEDYQRIHADNPFQRSAIADLLSRLPPRASILDLGCGTGIPAAQSLAAAGHHVTGIDVSARMVELAKRQVPEGEFLQEDMVQARFDDASFDAVVAYFSLLMLPKSDVAIMLDRIYGWLRSGGLLSISMVNFDADAAPVEFMGVQVRVTGYLPDAMAAAISESKLNLISLETVEHQPSLGPSEPQIFCLAHKATTS
jgi:ubiquinone/menaquinone biosynthesis C-methylase UbiE